MATVSFSYRSKKDTANIEIRFTYEEAGKRKSIYTRSKIEVSKSFWNKYRKGTNFRDADLLNLKNKIDEETASLRAFLLLEHTKTLEVNKEWLKDAVRAYYTPNTSKDTPTGLIAYLDYYTHLRKHEFDNKKSQREKWHTVKVNLQAFQKSTNRNYEIKDVNEQFVNDFVEYFQKESYAPTTIKKQFTFVKTLCKHAKTKGIQTSLELDTLKVNLKPENLPKIYLSFKELDKITALTGLHEHLDNARDWLIISCYTGQRISDFMRFDASMIRNVGDKHFIDFKQTKTGKDITVPIITEVLSILEKRNGQFPRKISDQRYNDYIKEVCKLAGIDKPTKGKITINIGTKADPKLRKVTGIYKKWELISSHTGRRSFATNHYGKIPTSIIKDLTGHGSEAMLLKYIGKTAKETAFEAYELMENIKK